MITYYLTEVIYAVTKMTVIILIFFFFGRSKDLDEDYAWIGIQMVNSVWRLVDDTSQTETLPYTKWDGSPGNQHKVAMEEGGNWFTFSDAETLPFVCESGVTDLTTAGTTCKLNITRFKCWGKCIGGKYIVNISLF